jgi:hypothetical protein
VARRHQRGAVAARVVARAASQVGVGVVTRARLAVAPGNGAGDLKQSKDCKEHKNFGVRHCRNSALGGEPARGARRELGFRMH